MFWRRYMFGVRPLLVWAESSRAADVTAAFHAGAWVHANRHSLR